MLLGAGALWGATTLAIKASPLRFIRPVKVLLYQLGAAALSATIAALTTGERIQDPSETAYIALLYQTVWVGGVTFLLWFRLLARYPASILQAGTSMTPLFGVVSAWILLGEPITPPFALAVALVVSGLLLINAKVSR